MTVHIPVQYSLSSISSVGMLWWIQTSLKGINSGTLLWVARSHTKSTTFSSFEILLFLSHPHLCGHDSMLSIHLLSQSPAIHKSLFWSRLWANKSVLFLFNYIKLNCVTIIVHSIKIKMSFFVSLHKSRIKIFPRLLEHSILVVPLCIRFYLHFNPQIESHFISLNCSKFWKTQVWAHTYNNYIIHSPEQSKLIMNDLLIELAKLRYQRTGKYEVAQQPSTTKSKMPSSIKSESTISKFYTANNSYCECIDKEHGTAKITEQKTNFDTKSHGIKLCRIQSTCSVTNEPSEIYRIPSLGPAPRTSSKTTGTSQLAVGQEFTSYRAKRSCYDDCESWIFSSKRHM